MALCMKHMRPMNPLYPTAARRQPPCTTPIARKSELHGTPILLFIHAQIDSLGVETITEAHP